MSAPTAANGNHVTGINDSIEDIIIESFDIYGLNYSLPVKQSLLKSVYLQIYDFPRVWINPARML